MTNLSLEWLGMLGNLLLVGSYLPQIYKLIKTKSAEDLSLSMWVIYVLGDVCLLAYSIGTGDLIFTALFALFSLENLIVLYLTYLYRKPALVQ